MIQINTGEESQKSGVMPKDADNFVNYCRNDLKLNIQGLMCIPPINEDSTIHFAYLRKKAEEYKLPYLSMGMSEDYKEAIHFGATHVRVGTIIFGERLERQLKQPKTKIFIDIYIENDYIRDYKEFLKHI